MLSLIVSMAILLNLFAPALSQAAATLAADPLTLEICSATPLAVNPGNEKRAPGGLHAHGLKHCMLCTVNTGSDTPPPVTAGLLTIPEGHDVYPALPVVAQWQPRHWSDAQPRGPPAAA